MSEMNYEKLRAALDNLQEQYDCYEDVQSNPDLSEVMRKAINNSVVYCWNICFDTLWKHMKKYLEQNIAKVPANPKDIFRTAHKIEMMDQSMLERLFEYLDIRNEVSHDYSQEKGDMATSKISVFIEDAEDLYQVMCEHSE